MLEFKGKIESQEILENGNIRAVFEVDKVRRTSFLRLLEKNKDKDIFLSVKRYREKRSLNANSYLWLLLEKLAEKLERPKEDIYLEYVKDYGIHRQAVINERAVETLSYIWQKNGIGWIVEKVDKDSDGFVVVNFYYGTSTYNTKQMARIINAVVFDCKEQEIETLPPEKLKGMIDEWGKREATK